MKSIPLHDGWRLTHCAPGGEPDASPRAWKAARVPGSVQTSSFGLPRRKLYSGTRVREVEWMAARRWVYRRALAVPEAGRDETVRLRFLGLDYRYEVRIDGSVRTSGEGMFHEIVVPLDAWRGRTVGVEVRLEPAPRDKAEYLETTKAQFGRGWDFAPALRTLGIWDEVRLETVPRLRVESAFVETRLHNAQRACVTVRVELSEQPERGWLDISLAGCRRRVPLLGSGRVTTLLEVESPRLWWPNGLGEPALHDLSIGIDAPGRRTRAFVQRVGLREVGRVPAVGQRPADIPLQFTINGLPFFVLGANWVPPDAAVGDIRDSAYDRPLKLLRDGHVNLVRVWGGGLREKRRFYEACDELGLLVFQDYPIACGMGQSEAYHRQLHGEAREIARALRRHPSVFLFSGGNENYHYWNMLDSDEPRLREAAELGKKAVNQGKPFADREWLGGAVKRYDEPVHLILGGVTAEEAPHCLYQNTSAMEGEGEVHGIWNWNPRIGDHRYRGYETLYDYWRAADEHFYSEASVSSIANEATIRDVTGDRSDRMPSWEDEVWRLHHGFHGAWDEARDLWLDIPSTEAVFGPIRSRAELVVLNQYLQAEGGRFMVEELRRKQPRATGVVWWGVNEPWPGLAGNALLDYFGRPKLSWPIVANALQPVILSLRYAALQARPLRGELWISCNRPGGFRGRYRADVLAPDGRRIDRYEGACAIDYLRSQPLKTLVPVPYPSGGALRVETTLLDDDGDGGMAVHRNRYLFGPGLRAEVLKNMGFRRTRNAPSA